MFESRDKQFVFCFFFFFWAYTALETLYNPTLAMCHSHKTNTPSLF